MQQSESSLRMTKPICSESLLSNNRPSANQMWFLNPRTDHMTPALPVSLVLTDHKTLVPHALSHGALAHSPQDAESAEEVTKHLSKHLKSLTDDCNWCKEHHPAPQAEPLKPSELPDQPWDVLCANLCEHTGVNSRWLERKRLTSVTTTTTGSVTSRLPQANSKAVQIAKMIQDPPDLHLVLLNYRSSKHPSTKVSPAESLMSRRLKTRLSAIPASLRPIDLDREKLREDDSFAKGRTTYDRCHSARNLPSLPPSLLRRNHRHLQPVESFPARHSVPNLLPHNLHLRLPCIC